MSMPTQYPFCLSEDTIRSQIRQGEKKKNSQCKPSGFLIKFKRLESKKRPHTDQSGHVNQTYYLLIKLFL